ncbi:hypothetical protein [Aquabacterium sp.]|uniref:hypothetical protein n=1 Tax=Aquabacterium sp. TaxID=1872578 RepID=UPI0037847160
MRLTARPALRAAVLGLLPLLAPALQAAEPAKPAAAKAAPKAAPKPATSRQQLSNQAKGLALATQTVEQITEAQLAVAARVLTGDADCEFNQKVAVNAVDGQPGHFTVAFKKAVYRMTPQETTTGAVRLEDKKAGMVWLQIPVKSMLMNAKIGQRMVDACTQPEQRAAVAAAEAAAKATQVAEAASAAAATAPAASAPATAPVPEAAPAATAAASAPQ